MYHVSCSDLLGKKAGYECMMIYEEAKVGEGPQDVNGLLDVSVLTCCDIYYCFRGSTSRSIYGLIMDYLQVVKRGQVHAGENCLGLL